MISTIQFKLLLRNNLGRGMFIVIPAAIAIYQLYFQTNIIHTQIFLNDLPAYLPYMHLYLLTLLCVLPVILLTYVALNKEKIDSNEVFDAHNQSNRTYLLGTGWAVIRIFLLLTAISLLFGIFVHLIGNDAPINIWYYLFYALTLTLPTVVFITGLSFFIFLSFRCGRVALLITLAAVALHFYFLKSFIFGMFDVYGLSLPNVFSSFAGHPNMGLYLLQRLCWLLAGCSLFFLAMPFSRRIPNVPLAHRRQLFIGILLFILAFGCGVGYFGTHHGELLHRKTYRDINARYYSYDRLSAVTHDIVFSQKGSRMYGESRLKLRNDRQVAIESIVLYLNPDLNITKTLLLGKEVNHIREHHAVIIPGRVEPGEEVMLELSYIGGIDESICNLDISDSELSDKRPDYMTLHWGKRFAFLKKRFTLLTPDALWYPVTVFPIHPDFSLWDKEFTSYSLRVDSPGEKIWLSQGEITQSDGSVTFKTSTPLTGITLTGGDYIKYSCKTDRLAYEVYCLEGREKLFKGFEMLKDSVSVMFDEYFEELEENNRINYPSERIRLIESPITYYGTFRENMDKSGCVQPEMVLLPEQLSKLLAFDSEKMMQAAEEMPGNSKQRMLVTLKYFLKSIFQNERILYDYTQQNVITSLLDSDKRNNFVELNPYRLSPLFLGHTFYLVSSDYPVIDLFLNTLLMDKEPRISNMTRAFIEHLRMDALNYLDGHSLKEFFESESIDHRLDAIIIDNKALDLWICLNRAGIPEDKFRTALIGYVQENRFKVTDIDQLNIYLKDYYRVDLSENLERWYTADKLTAYQFKDLKVMSIKDKDDPMKRGTRLEVAVSNDSDIDGLISLCVTSMIGKPEIERTDAWVNSTDDVLRYDCVIPAKGAKKIAVTLPIGLMKIDTYLSRNMPSIIDVALTANGITDEMEPYEADLPLSYFDNNSGDLIVDNEDENFEVVNASRFRLGMLFKKKERIELHVHASMKSVPEWAFVVDSDAYGKYSKTAVVKDAGKGDAKVIWKTQISEPGQYELFVYLPKIQSNAIMRMRSDLLSAAKKENPDLDYREFMNKVEINQYYKLIHTGGEEPIIQEMSSMSTGWNSLGKFYLPTGECGIELSDKGNPEQKIYGDAVKWIKR